MKLKMIGARLMIDNGTDSERKEINTSHHIAPQQNDSCAVMGM